MICLLTLAGLALAMVAVFGPHRDRVPVGDPLPERSFSSETGYTPPGMEGYVGSQACAECHQAISQQYATHPMSQSTRLVSLEPSLHDGEQRVPGATRVLAATCQNGEMLHHELMYDSDGAPIYRQSIAMDYVVGSGQRAFAYLYHRGEGVFMSPLNWYTQAGGWDLSPGYQLDDPRRFDRRINEECLSCHVGRVAPLARGSNRFPVPLARELAIGCENCHGPGGEHVAFHRGELSTAIADPIVNPVQLPVERRESVCNQCHLQAAVRLLRPGRSHFDFRPGMNLDEIWTILDTGSEIGEDGRTKAVNHVQQMRDSRCYTASEGALGCISCHDPHRVPDREERFEFYRARCLSCHDVAACHETIDLRTRREDACTVCHMPSRDASNISHVTQTDHRIVRRPATPAAVDRPEESTNDLLAFFDPPDGRLSEWEQQRALGVGAWIHLTKTHRQPPADLRHFLEELLSQQSDGMVLLALGSLAYSFERFEEARQYYEQAVNFPEVEEDARSALLNIYYLTQDWPSALECADTLLKIDPGSARLHALKADILGHLGRLPEGVDAARRALELNPTLVSVREWLIDSLQELGRFDEEQQERELLLRINSARLPESLLPVMDQ